MKTTISTLTMKQVINVYGEEVAPLIRAVSAAHGGWADWKRETMRDVYNHGANTGVSFCYTHECVNFWKKNKKAIRAVFQLEAEQCGESMFEMVRNFSGLTVYTDDEIGIALWSKSEDGYIYNTFVYAAVEIAARYCVETLEHNS
ncbi:DUF7222 domain-containing protein [Burkholderia pseudomallei]|uniref:DUF7222 domain-containing protein n=1 Tax=Burkholderia pseudomallei TaxID=28450 RepID=UPI00105F6137|nr:hypothetical protein [Burkholderia pseudomallei]